MTRIALATAAEIPDLDHEGQLLLEALRSRGLDAEPAVWDDTQAKWDSFDLVVVRSTWDYAERIDEFLSWASNVESQSRLLNSADVLRWNTNKHYLDELSAAGVPVVPTQFLEPGDSAEHEYLDVEHVVKPAVSAGSRNTLRVAADQPAKSTEHAQRLLDAGRSVMVQPYLAEVDTAGETAMLFLDGSFSHAMRKGPLLPAGMDLVEGLFAEEDMSPREADDVERRVADQALAALPDQLRADLLYARVDVLPTDEGPRLLELELAEPSLFLDHYPDVIAPFAAAIERRANQP